MDEKFSLNEEHFNLDFLVDDIAIGEKQSKKEKCESYKILIADDDEEVHSITKMVLKDFTFEKKGLHFIDSYSGEETKKFFMENDDIAVIFLDVVMEKNNAGLEVVDFIRNEMNNHFTRIILRTGQPGEAPEEKVIFEYDINDYRLKTDMTVQRTYTSMYEALRSFRDLMKIEKNRLGLKKIIEASSELFVHNDIEDFYISILNQLMNFNEEASSIIFMENVKRNGFVYINDFEQGKIVVATGKYQEYTGLNLKRIPALKPLYDDFKKTNFEESSVKKVKDGFVLYTEGRYGIKNFIYIEDNSENYDLELIKVFLSNYSLSLDNFQMNQKILFTQKKIIYTLGEIIESRSKETANHVRRVSEIADILFRGKGFSESDREMYKIASTLHDIGKIGISDSILLKPEKLSTEEFEEIKNHTLIGYKMLKDSDLEILREAAIIAKSHHEKYDGSGYPEGLKGDDIPIEARIVSIADVFDAITHKRCYKDAWDFDEAYEYMLLKSGMEFDPELIDLFKDEIDEIREIIQKIPD